MYKFILPLILCLNLSHAVPRFANLLNCKNSIRSYSNEKLNSFLTEQGNLKSSPSDQQTTFFHRIDPSGYLVFRKGKADLWFSTFNLIEGADTPQGDLRFFMQVAGPQISRFFGFRILEVAEDQIEIWVPGQTRIEKKRKLLNKTLKKLGYDPLALHLKKAGLLSAEEILNFSIERIDEDTHVTFPYDDVDPRLSPHEVGFHLGALLYPKALHVRAELVNLFTKSMVTMLKVTKRQSLVQLADILIHERSVELDVGTASPQTALALIRKSSGMKPYDKSNSGDTAVFLKTYYETISPSLGIYSKSYTTPAMAVLQRINLATRIGSELIPIENRRMPQAQLNLASMSYGKTLEIPKEDQEILLRIMSDFKIANEYQNEKYPPTASLSSFQWLLSQMDQRLAEIKEAIDLISDKQI